METIQFPAKTKANKVHKCDFCLEAINVGETYYKSVHKYDGVYSWKTHLECSDIASKLKMYDHADEGVTTEDFIETIKDEYSSIMSNFENDLYESKDFVVPSFKVRLEKVIDFHLKQPAIPAQ